MEEKILFSCDVVPEDELDVIRCSAKGRFGFRVLSCRDESEYVFLSRSDVRKLVEFFEHEPCSKCGK